MNLLLIILVSAVWAFFAALLIDRPDLAAVIHKPYVNMVHAGFAVVFLAIVFSMSFPEMRRAETWWKNAPKIYLRNLGVIALGVLLLIFASREVLHGVDPSGVRHLW